MERIGGASVLESSVETKHRIRVVRLASAISLDAWRCFAFNLLRCLAIICPRVEDRCAHAARQPSCTVCNVNVRCLSMVRRNVDYGRAAVCRRFARIRRVHSPFLRLSVNPGKKIVSSSRCSSFDLVATTIVHSRDVYIYIFFSRFVRK